MLKYIFISLIFINFLFSNTLLNDKIELTKQEQEYLANKKTLKTHIEPAWYPYSFYEDNAPQGFNYDIQKLIADKLGLELEVNKLNFYDAVKSLETLEIDLILEGWDGMSESTDVISSTRKLYPYVLSLVSTKGYKNFDELTNKKIGYFEGNEYIHELNQNAKYILYASDTSLFNDIVRGKIDAGIFELQSAYYNSERLGISKVININLIDNLGEYMTYAYTNVHRNNELLNNIINKLISNEEINEIKRKRGFIKDSKSAIDDLFTNEEKQWFEQNPFIKIAVMSYWDDFEGNNRHKDYINLLNKYGNNKFTALTYDIWKDGYEDVLKGNIHGITNLSWTKEREEKQFNYTKPYSFEPIYLYVKKDNNSIQKLEDLKGKSVLLKDGSVFSKIIEEISSDIKITKLKSDYDMFEAIKTSNNYDAVLSYAYDTQKEQNYNIKMIQKIYHKTGEVYIGVNKMNPILVDIINKIHDSIPAKELEDLRNKVYKKKGSKAKKINLTQDEKEFLKNNTFNIHTIDWKPFFSNDAEGIGFDVFKDISKELGINYKVINETNAVELFKSVKDETNAIILSTTQTEARKEYGSFTKPYLEFPIAVATDLHEEFMVDLNHLDGKTIAVGKNYSSHRLFEKYMPKVKLKLVNSTDEALKLLANGKVYGAIDILPVLAYKLNKHGYQNVKISGTSDFKFQVQMMVSKESEKLVDILNKAIDSYDKDRLQGIVNKWLVKTKTVKETDYTLFYQWFIPLAIITFILIITSLAQKRNNKTIESLKSRYQNFIKYSSEGIFIIDPKSAKLIDYSDAVKKLLGYSDKELKDIKVFDWDKELKSVDDYEQIISKVGYKPIEFERVHTKKDGSTYVAAVTASRIDIDNETYIYSSVRDISEKIELRQIRKLTNELQVSQKLAKVGIAIIDDLNDYSKTIQCNDVYHDIQENDERVPLSINLCIENTDPIEMQRVQKGVEIFNKNGFAFFEALKIKTFKGNTKYIDVYWQKIKDEITNKEVIFNVIQDVTDRVLKEEKLEQQNVVLMQQQRLAQQGEMLEMIGHQWRQPLNGMALGIQVAKMMYEEGNKDLANSKLDSALESISYLSKTIDDFKSFFKSDKIPTEFKLIEIIDSSLKIIENRIDRSELIINKNICCDIDIQSFKSELGQVLLVIFNNAIDEFISKQMEGTIFIEVDCQNENIVIKVKDNAGGIPKEVFPVIFDAYFSTKDKNGTGLGLYMAKMIVVKLLKGNLIAYNEESSAVFEIILPTKIS